MFNMIKVALFGYEPVEIPPRPVPPRDEPIPGFNEVFKCIENEIKKSHNRKIGRSRSQRS